jgi:D-ribose pyranose/furanose isomerase RbsD
VLTYNQIELYQTQLATIENNIQQEAVQVAVEVEQTTEAVRQLLVAISSLEPVHEQNSDACNALLASSCLNIRITSFLAWSTVTVSGSAVPTIDFQVASLWPNFLFSSK